MLRYANPKRFLDLSAAVLPWLWLGAAGLMGWGLWAGLFASPPDYQQSESVRIMYVHVPSAWLSMFLYGVMFAASVVGLVWRHPLADAAAKEAAPIGACFTAICLVTGSLWGRPMWGTYWAWDPRLTSELVLLILYLGYMALWAAIEDRQKAARSAAVLCIVGVINIPIIHFSVEWWNSLHQGPSVVRFENGALAPAIDPSMLWPLLAMAVGSTLLAIAVLFVRIGTEIGRRRLATLMAQQAAG
ncbi:MAG: heme ABC transporter permease [Alphaproteobacteria bacterium]|nr:heme ABC transporter permease [Alphaproteobacteria bacterium]